MSISSELKSYFDGFSAQLTTMDQKISNRFDGLEGRMASVENNLETIGQEVGMVADQAGLVVQRNVNRQLGPMEKLLQKKSQDPATDLSPLFEIFERIYL